jgi:hypothetical protein
MVELLQGAFRLVKSRGEDNERTKTLFRYPVGLAAL